MTVSLLSAANWPIVGFLCKILGKVMNFIYTFLDGVMPTDNGLVGLSIIIYTIIVYMCMLPMTINQQKTSRLTAVMNPEIQAIQKKYRNKKDQASAMKQNEEIQQVYDKYGASMMGGCLPLLIQMPFLFALYPVIYDIQTYVPAIANAPAEVNRFLTIPSLTVTPMDMIKNAGSYGIPAAAIIVTAIALPVISAATQVISMKLSQSISGQNNKSGNDQMESTMKTMNTTMPILSLFMVTTLPTGIGVYWIFSAVVRIVQQFFINKHLKKMSIEELIEKNKDKAKKKQAKRKENAERVNAMAQTSTKSINTSAKRDVSGNKNVNTKNVKNANASKPGSLASKANMVKKFNENK